MSQKPVYAYSIKLGEEKYVDVALFPSKEAEAGSFIKLILFDRGKRMGLFLKKDKAALLTHLLQLLIHEGSKSDYEKLKRKYPGQRSWHIR